MGAGRNVTGSEEALQEGEEASSQGAAQHAQGPHRHRDGGLAQGAGHTEGLDQAVVCAQARPPRALQEPQTEGNHQQCLTQLCLILLVLLLPFYGLNSCCLNIYQ